MRLKIDLVSQIALVKGLVNTNYKDKIYFFEFAKKKKKKQTNKIKHFSPTHKKQKITKYD